MVDFVSQYTGDQIETMLAAVSNKIDKADLATTLTDDPTVPAAVSLLFAINTAVEAMGLNISQNLMTLTGDQTVDGIKAFTSVIQARNGITLSANKFITLAAADPTSDNHAVNRGFIKTHGLDASSGGIGLKAFVTAGGYVGLDFDPTEFVAMSDADSWVVVVKSSVDNKAYTLSPIQINNSVYSDLRWTYLNADYTTFKSNYASDQTALNTAINARVTTISYTADQTAVNTAINARVLQSVYDTRQTAIDTSLAAKMDYSISGTATAAASATVALITVPKSDAAMFIVSAIFVGTPKPAVFRVTMTCDGTTAYVVSDALFAGSLTFTATVSGTNMILNAVNGSSTVAVTMKYKTLVRY